MSETSLLDSEEEASTEAAELQAVSMLYGMGRSSPLGKKKGRAQPYCCAPRIDLFDLHLAAKKGLCTLCYSIDDLLVGSNTVPPNTPFK